MVKAGTGNIFKKTNDEPHPVPLEPENVDAAMSNMRTRNLIASIVLLVLSAGYGFMTSNLPTRAIENSTQPSFFPWVVTACLIILSVMLLARGFLPAATARTPEPMNIPVWKMGFGLAAALAYLAALPDLGFLAANILLFVVLMWLYGERRPVALSIGSLVIPIAVFFLFREVFQIRLPAGVLGWVL